MEKESVGKKSMDLRSFSQSADMCFSRFSSLFFWYLGAVSLARWSTTSGRYTSHLGKKLEFLECEMWVIASVRRLDTGQPENGGVTE